MTRVSSAERFWAKVDLTLGCWLWTGWRLQGYGQIVVNRKRWRAHRLAYELLVGPIPAGMTLDHLCRVRHCVNPEHLEVVPAGVNAMRGNGPAALNAVRASCVHGHEFDEANTYLTPTGRRMCKACGQARSAAYARRRLAS